MLSHIQKVLDVQGVRFWDVRSGVVESNTISCWNDTVKEISSGKRDGFSVRVLYNNGWGFVYSEKDNYAVAAKQALAYAKALDAKHPPKQEFYTGKPVKARVTTNCKVNPHDLSFEEKSKQLLEYSKAGLKEKHVATSQASYYDIIKQTRYMSSEGSDIDQTLIYSSVGISLTVKDGRVEVADERAGIQGGAEVFKDLSKLYSGAKNVATHLLKAKVPKGGTFPVICNGALTDVFIHEALGHACEADLVMQNTSCVKGKLGEQLAPDYVNVYDDATLANSWGSFFYDDEGIAAQKTPLLEQGKLTSYMHSRQSAAHFGTRPTGNARAQSVAHRPKVRMSNTYITPGDASFDEMLEGIKYGFYLMDSKGGEVDTALGNFLFNTRYGFVIEKGELTTPIREVSLGGNTLAILKNIASISKDYDTGVPGYCGKAGQTVPVVGVNPKIFIASATVGGAQ